MWRSVICAAPILAVLTSPASAQLPGFPTATAAPTPAPLPAPPVIEPDGPALETTMLGADATRRGWVAANGVEPPLRHLWRVSLDAVAGAPVTGGGRLYVPTRRGIVALDLRTGRQLWQVERERRYGPASLAFAAGTLVTTGPVAAYDAATGEPRWSSDLQLDATNPPLIAGEVVVLQGRSLQALDLATGMLRWSDGATDGNGGAPSAAGDRVYQDNGCTAAAFDRRNGRPLWTRSAGCTGGSGGTALLHRDRVYTSTDELGTLRAQDGADVEGSSFDLIGADAGVEFDRYGVSARDLASGRRLWSAEDSSFGRPLIVGDALVRTQGAGGSVEVRELRSGQLRWTGKLRPGGGPGDAEDQADLALADGILIAVRNSTVDALVPGRVPIPLRLPRRRVIDASDGLVLRGRIRGVLQPTLRLESDAFPFGRFDTQGPGPITDGRTGAYELAVEPDLNTRYRITGGGSRTRSLTLFVVPEYDFDVINSNNSVTAKVAISGSRRVRFRGRTAHLYLGRRAAERLDRIDTVTVTGRRRRTGVATFRFPALSSVGKRDFLLTCVEGLAKVGQGPNDGIARNCGAARIDY